MKLSKAVRAARKKAQLARLERKGDTDYPSFYANQPFQQAKAKRNAEIVQARNDLKAAEEALAVARIAGGDVAQTEAAFSAAEKRLDDVSPKGGRLTAELSAAGAV